MTQPLFRELNYRLEQQNDDSVPSFSVCQEKYKREIKVKIPVKTRNSIVALQKCLSGGFWFILCSLIS